MAKEPSAEIIQLTQRLLDAIASADWATYQELCDPSLTSFEPEALGQLVEGLEFHHFYFKLSGNRGLSNTTLCAPRVRLMDDVAVITYIRLNQRSGSENPAATTGSSETRVWQRQGGRWRHVHFHRSPLPTAP